MPIQPSDFIVVNRGGADYKSTVSSLPAGEQGEQGEQGVQGEQGIQGEQGEQGIQGEQGQQGIQGPAGAGIVFKGQVDVIPSGSGDVTILDGSSFTPAQGDAVIYTGDDTLSVYNGLSWVDGGSIQGPQGIQGEQGIQGDQGIQGIQGIQGVPGEEGQQGTPGGNGLDGLPGDQGDKGDDGDSAYQVAVDNGFSGTEAEWLASLQGETGTPGADGGTEIFLDKSPQLGGNLDGQDKNISNVNTISALKGNFGNPANLRSFNVFGTGTNCRLNIQSTTGGNPGVEMTTTNNTTRTLLRHQDVGTSGTELQLWNQVDGGGISKHFIFGNDGAFYITQLGSGNDAPNNCGFRNALGKAQYKNATGEWKDIDDITGAQGEKGDKGDKGDPFVYSDFTPAQLAGLEGPQGIQGVPGEEGPEGPQGLPGVGTEGPAGPTAISTDVDNFATLGTDGLVYVPQPPPSSASLELEWLYQSGTGGPNPNFWQINNNVDTSLATEINLSSTVYPNRDIKNILALLKSGQQIYIQQRADDTKFLNLDVTGDAIDNGTYFTIPVSPYDSGVPFDVNAFCSFLIYQLGGSGDGGGTGGGTTADDALALAKGAALNLKQELLAAAGQPAFTVLAVTATNTGRVQGISLGDGNVIEVYANGDDYSNSVVLYREFMQLGEPICFTGLGPGAIITSTQGFYGSGEQVQGSNESPMPLSSLGLAFTDTFVYCFRNSNNAPGTGSSTGQIIITNGPLPSKVTLTRVDIVVLGQENIALNPFEQVRLYTNANGEYRIVATNPVMGGVQAYMGSNAGPSPNDPADSSQRFYDARLIMPTTNDGITWPRSGNVSAPYDNTVVDFWVRDGFTRPSPGFIVSPGSPVDFDGSAGTGANDSDYEPNGATRVKAKGLISAYSGADSAGLEASPLMPTSAMSQLVAQPFAIDDTADGGNSGVAIASPYEGTAKYYEWDNVAGVAVLKYTVPLTRGSNGVGITLTSPADQLFPCSGIIANEPGLDADPSVIQLVGDLGPGYVIADVPITVVSQNATSSYTPEIRSQNGTTTTGIISDDDETLQLGWTPPAIKAELTTDVDGYIRKREIAGDGSITYPLT